MHDVKFGTKIKFLRLCEKSTLKSNLEAQINTEFKGQKFLLKELTTESGMYFVKAGKKTKFYIIKILIMKTFLVTSHIKVSAMPSALETSGFHCASETRDGKKCSTDPRVNIIHLQPAGQSAVILFANIQIKFKSICFFVKRAIINMQFFGILLTQTTKDSIVPFAVLYANNEPRKLSRVYDEINITDNRYERFVVLTEFISCSKFFNCFSIFCIINNVGNYGSRNLETNTKFHKNFMTAEK